jgi:hypothetical protein
VSTSERAIPPTPEPDEDEPELSEEEEREPESEPVAEVRSAPPARRFDKLLSFLADTYATADPRSLAVFRVALGTMLFADVARRIPDLAAHYSNAGWLTNHFALFRPMSSHQFSVYLAFGPPAEVYVMAGIHLLVNLLLIVGYRTRLMTVLAAIFITSLNSRNILLENGGWVVLNLLTMWAMFLPLGRRFSVDALLTSLRARREGTAAALNDRQTHAPDRTPLVSIAVTALILQWAVIYYFNVVHKGGLPWRDGTAVYYFFQQDRMVTDLGAWLREALPLSMIKVLTWSTLAIEGAVVVLLLAPLRSGKARLVAFGLVCLLHLSIDAVVQLGPFSWAMIVMFLALAPSWVWDRVDARRRERRPERLVAFDPRSGVALAVCRFIKRLDAIGLVGFVPVPPGPDDPELPSTVRRKLARRTLVVVDPKSSDVWTGKDAVTRLTDALPLPARLLGLPGVRWLISSRIERALAKRRSTAVAWGLDDLPGTDRIQPPPSDARRFVKRMAFALGQAAVLLVMVALGSQVLIENRAVPEWLKPKQRPEWMTSLVIYPRLFQGWSMFAPSPPNEDGRLVVEGRTADGRRLDPLAGGEPVYEVQPKGGFRMNQIWGDFHRRIGEPRFSVYLPGVRDMLLNYHEITGRPQDRLVAFDLWYVTEIIPPPGAPRQPATRRKLISHGSVNYPPGTAGADAPPAVPGQATTPERTPGSPRFPIPQPTLRSPLRQSTPPR